MGSSLSFTHPQVVPNLYDSLSSAEHKRIYFIVLSFACNVGKILGTPLMLLFFMFSTQG